MKWQAKLNGINVGLLALGYTTSSVVLIAVIILLGKSESKSEKLIASNGKLTIVC